MHLHIFDKADLMPPSWLQDSTKPYYLFNPGLVRYGDQILMSYRVITANGQRRLAICRLNEAMQVVPGSAVPFSDSIVDGGDWHADARFCSFRDRLYLHYNDGYRQPNHIYLIEVDPGSLRACTPARELLLEGPRRLVEKNWMLFAHDNELWAVYSICPQIILRVALNDHGPILCRPVYQHAWDATPYTTQFGELRGGSPPVRVGDQYISFFHSAYRVRFWRRLCFRLLRKRPTKILRYVGGAYGFAAQPPFAPLWYSPTPLLQPSTRLRRNQSQLDQRVERSVYPCGALFQDQQWLVTFGAQEEYCCLATLPVDLIAKHTL